MNALIPVIRDSGQHGPDRQPADGIPVFGGPAFVGSTDRADRPVLMMRLASAGQSVFPSDEWMQLRIAAALRAESWIGADFVGFSVKDGIVYLAGEVDSMHAKFDASSDRRGDAGHGRVVDGLWVSCE